MPDTKQPTTPAKIITPTKNTPSKIASSKSEKGETVKKTDLPLAAPVQSAIPATPPTTPIFGTKPDLPGTSAGEAATYSGTVQPRESPLSAINDGGRMVFYLFPLLLCVVGAIRLLAKYQQREGRLPGIFAAITSRNEEARLMRSTSPGKRKTGGLMSALIGSLNLSKARDSGNAAIRIIESVPIAGANLHLIEVRGRSILIGTTAGQVNVIAEFADAQQEEDNRFRSLMEEAATNLDGLEISTLADSSLLVVGSLEEELRDTSASMARSAQRLQTLR